MFNGSPDNPGARPGLGGTAPSDTDREVSADLRLIPKGDFQTNWSGRQKLACSLIQEKRTTLFRRKGLPHFSRETVKRNCCLRRITVWI